MADLTPCAIGLLAKDYPTKYSLLLPTLTPYLTEIETARGAQASLLANLNYLLAQKINVSGLAADFTTNGNRIRGAVTPVYSDELVPKSYADGLVFAAALPSQAGNAGMSVTTDGTTASWGVSAADCMAILNFIGY